MIPITAPTLVRVAMGAVSALLAGSAFALFLGLVSFSSARPILIGLAAGEILLGFQWLASSRHIVENVQQFGNDVRVLRQGIELLERQQFDSHRLVSLRSVVTDNSAVAALGKLERMVNTIFECDKEMFYLPSWLLLLPVQIALGIEVMEIRVCVGTSAVGGCMV